MDDFNYIFGTVHRRIIPEGALMAKFKSTNKFVGFDAIPDPYPNKSYADLIKRYADLHNQKNDDFIDSILGAMSKLTKGKNNMLTKEKLHRLVEGLDLHKLENFRVTSLNGVGDFVIDEVLTKCQKEPTIDERLLKAGFALSYTGTAHLKYSKDKIVAAVYFDGDTIITHTNDKSLDDKLINKSKDHEQIFADIAYLENKYAKK